MSDFCDFLELGLLNHAFGGDDFVRPAVVHIGLSTTEPADDGSNITEPTDGYSRVELANEGENSVWSDAEINEAGYAEKENIDAITFPEPTGNWGTVTHFFLVFEDGEVDNFLGAGGFPEPKTVESGDDPVTFNVGELIITLD